MSKYWASTELALSYYWVITELLLSYYWVITELALSYTVLSSKYVTIHLCINASCLSEGSSVVPSKKRGNVVLVPLY